jgi:hypothetical protein
MGTPHRIAICISASEVTPMPTYSGGMIDLAHFSAAFARGSSWAKELLRAWIVAGAADVLYAQSLGRSIMSLYTLAGSLLSDNITFTYGNYGGLNYSAGQIGGRTPYNIDPNIPGQAPIDFLDALFYQHDFVYQAYQDGFVSEDTLPGADINLIEEMIGLATTDPQFFESNPDAGLYAGVATVALVGNLATEGYLGSTSPSDLAMFMDDTLAKFDFGAAVLSSEAQSLFLSEAQSLFY